MSQYKTPVKIDIHPTVYAIMLGLVSRLDVALAAIKDAAIDYEWSEWEVDTEAHLIELGVAGLFNAMVVKVEIMPGTDRVRITNTENGLVAEEISLSESLIAMFSAIKEPSFYAYIRLWGDGTIQVVRQVENPK